MELAALLPAVEGQHRAEELVQSTYLCTVCDFQPAQIDALRHLMPSSAEPGRTSTVPYRRDLTRPPSRHFTNFTVYVGTMPTSTMLHMAPHCCRQNKSVLLFLVKSLFTTQWCGGSESTEMRL